MNPKESNKNSAGASHAGSCITIIVFIANKETVLQRLKQKGKDGETEGKEEEERKRKEENSSAQEKLFN